jgi:hypothetical protein
MAHQDRKIGFLGKPPSSSSTPSGHNRNLNSTSHQCHFLSSIERGPSPRPPIPVSSIASTFRDASAQHRCRRCSRYGLLRKSCASACHRNGQKRLPIRRLPPRCLPARLKLLRHDVAGISDHLTRVTLSGGAQWNCVFCRKIRGWSLGLEHNWRASQFMPRRKKHLASARVRTREMMDCIALS